MECAWISAHVFAYLHVNWCVYDTICLCADVYICEQMSIWLHMYYVDDSCMWMHICMYIEEHMCV